MTNDVVILADYYLFLEHTFQRYKAMKDICEKVKSEELLAVYSAACNACRSEWVKMQYYVQKGAAHAVPHPLLKEDFFGFMFQKTNETLFFPEYHHLYNGQVH